MKSKLNFPSKGSQRSRVSFRLCEGFSGNSNQLSVIQFSASKSVSNPYIVSSPQNTALEAEIEKSFCNLTEKGFVFLHTHPASTYDCHQVTNEIFLLKKSNLTV